MVSEEWVDWLLVTPVYPLRRGHDEYPPAEADRGRHFGFARFKVFPGGPGQLSLGVRAQREVDVDEIVALKAVGYWQPSEMMQRREREYGYGGQRRPPEEIAARRKQPPNPLPHPARLVWAGSDPVELSGVLAYLRAGQEWIQFRGWSYCRFECGIAPSALGDRDLTDGVWVWPEGLAHYVEMHSVRLPKEFIDHMRSQGWRVTAQPITRWVDRAATDRPNVDITFWIAWSRRIGLSAAERGGAADGRRDVGSS
jgi:hypothetical protein